MPFDDLETAARLAPEGWPAAPGRQPGRSAMRDRRRRAGRMAAETGRAAEDRVERWYERRGATVLARRWRPGRAHGGGEVDLIVRDGNVVAFVEVKARRSCAEAAHSISAAQWRRLEAAALRFMLVAETGETDMRFDVALLGRDGAMEVIENARMM